MKLRTSNYTSWILVLLFTTAASLITYYQSGRIWPIIDYAYQVENGYRIFLGQIPYKDFGLVLMPGTYCVIALLIKLFGASHLVQAIYVSVLAGLTIPLAYYILSKINTDPIFNLILTFPLIFAGYAIYPFYSYDINTGFFMILGAAFTLYALEKPKNITLFILGMVLAIPSLFKQNTGMVFDLSLLGILLADTLISKKPLLSIKKWLLVCLGSLIVIGSFLVWVYAFSDWDNFFFHTFSFANQIRPVVKKIPAILKSYIGTGSFLFYALFVYEFAILTGNSVKDWSNKLLTLLGVLSSSIIIPGIIIWKIFPLQLPFLFYYDKWFYYNLSIWYALPVFAAITSLWVLLFKKQNNYFFALLPLPFILTANASFLAQGVTGSTYGIWPFLFFLMALIVRNHPQIKWKFFFMALALIWSAALALYLHFNMRLNYVLAEGAQAKATHPLLKGLGTPGPWIEQFENLLNYTEENIPAQDLILTIPGEDPFYVFSDRVPPLPYEQINFYTLPYPAEWMIEESVKKRIPWVIYKKTFQTPGGYKPLTNLDHLLLQYYDLQKELAGYFIFKLRS